MLWLFNCFYIPLILFLLYIFLSLDFAPPLLSLLFFPIEISVRSLPQNIFVVMTFLTVASEVSSIFLSTFNCALWQCCSDHRMLSDSVHNLILDCPGRQLTSQGFSPQLLGSGSLAYISLASSNLAFFKFLQTASCRGNKLSREFLLFLIDVCH